MVRKKSAMKYMRRIGQNTGMLKLRACSEPQVSGHVPPPRITATHPPHIPGRTHTLKKVMQKAMTKAFVSEYQNLNSGSLRRQEWRLSRKWGSGTWQRRRRRGRWSMDWCWRGGSPANERAELVIPRLRQRGPLGLGIELRRQKANQQVQHVDAKAVGYDVPTCHQQEGRMSAGQVACAVGVRRRPASVAHR